MRVEEIASISFVSHQQHGVSRDDRGTQQVGGQHAMLAKLAFCPVEDAVSPLMALLAFMLGHTQHWLCPGLLPGLRSFRGFHGTGIISRFCVKYDECPKFAGRASIPILLISVGGHV